MTSDAADHRRVRLSDYGVQPVGMFAVMRHTGNQARFTALHAKRQTALEEANRLAAESVEKYGAVPTCYYIIQIVGRVGIIDGRIEASV